VIETMYHSRRGTRQVEPEHGASVLLSQMIDRANQPWLRNRTAIAIACQ